MLITKCDRCGAIIEDKNKKCNNVFDAISEAIKNAVYSQILYSDNAECVTLRARNNMTIETTFRVLDDNGILSLCVDTDELPDGVQPW